MVVLDIFSYSGIVKFNSHQMSLGYNVRLTYAECLMVV